MFIKSSVFILAAVAELVAGHGAIVSAVGDMGGEGTALGIVATTPRDGSRRNPDQQDSTRFRDETADTCGETLGGGDNNPTAQIPQMLAANGGSMPMISAGGMVMMTLHQVNGDGAGPYTCMIDGTGTGTQWTNIPVTTNVPGDESRSDARATDFPLTAQVPAGQECTGTVAGMTNVCMVRCNNEARAGPFGGCVPVQMVTPDAAAGNVTTAATSPAAKKPAAVNAAANSATATETEDEDDEREQDDKRSIKRAISFFG